MCEVSRWMLVVVLALTLPGCAPKDVIPTTPKPASPPPAAVEASPPAHDEAEAPPAVADDEAKKKEALAAAEQAAYERARPIFDKYCGKCHASSGKKATPKTLGHLNIDTYPFGGHHATTVGETVREVLGVGGKKATMPKDDPGAVTGADLDAIVEWSKAFDASHAAGLHHHGDHDEDHEHH